MANLTDMLSKFVTANTASTSVSETLMMPPDNNGRTKSPASCCSIQSRNPNPEPNVAPVVAPVVTPVPKASIPFPSRRNDERRRKKANDQNQEFYEIFREKLSELARTPLNENCSAVILNKLPKKLGDPGRFLIPCEFTGITTCNALADLGASINLMPYYVMEQSSLPD
ncbi:hypothetical protein Tco_1498975 [Tanacetum coccineum]